MENPHQAQASGRGAAYQHIPSGTIEVMAARCRYPASAPDVLSRKRRTVILNQVDDGAQLGIHAYSRSNMAIRRRTWPRAAGTRSATPAVRMTDLMKRSFGCAACRGSTHPRGRTGGWSATAARRCGFSDWGSISSCGQGVSPASSGRSPGVLGRPWLLLEHQDASSGRASPSASPASPAPTIKTSGLCILFSPHSARNP